MYIFFLQERLKIEREKERENLTRKPPEGTPPESVQVTACDEILIMAQHCGMKGKRVRGLGSFPRMELADTTSSTTGNVGMIEMQERMNELETSLNETHEQNAKLIDLLSELVRNGHGNYHATSMNLQQGIYKHKNTYIDGNM